jgi:hypothetical protein
MNGATFCAASEWVSICSNFTSFDVSPMCFDFEPEHGNGGLRSLCLGFRLSPALTNTTQSIETTLTIRLGSNRPCQSSSRWTLAPLFPPFSRTAPTALRQVSAAVFPPIGPSPSPDRNFLSAIGATADLAFSFERAFLGLDSNFVKRA